MKGMNAKQNSTLSPCIYAVVLNWNRADDTLNCLQSLVKQEDTKPRLLVVDNGSTDKSASRIGTVFPQAEILLNQSNLGFGRGINRGIQHAFEAGADYVFLANNDATLESRALARLLEHAEDDVGLLSPVIYYYTHPDIVWSSGGKTNPLNLEKTDEFQGKKDPDRWPEIIERDFITGCGVLIPRRTYEQVGQFDERFEMYYEDADLCRRVRNAGLRILVIPGAKMWHKVSMSSGGSDSPNERYWMAKSSMLFFRKHAHGAQKLVVIFWRAGSAWRTCLRLAAKHRWASLKAYGRGLYDGLRERSDR